MFKNMRITVEINTSDLKEIQKATGQRKKSPAVRRALSEFLRLQQRKKFIDRVLAGKTDFTLSNDELETRDI